MLTDDQLAAWAGLAKRDDWHHHFVGSDLRQLIGELQRARAKQAGEQNACEMPEVAAMRYIEQLRDGPGHTVEIICDDDEAVYKSEQMAIAVIADWTNYQPRRFYGQSVLQCLAKAVGDLDTWKAAHA